MRSHRTDASSIALCGVLAGLALVFMLLSGIIPAAVYCGPILASVLLVPILQRCGSRLSVAWYFAVAILSLLLSPDKESAMLFAFLGYYPILQPVINKIHAAPLRWFTKALFFNAATCGAYWILLAVMGIEALKQELIGGGWFLFAVTIVLGNVTFFLLDFLLQRVRSNLKWGKKHR